MLCWAVVRVLARYGNVAQLRKPAQTVLALLMIQLGLGFFAYLTRVQWGEDSVQPLAGMVFSTVAHVAGGALLLATSVILAIQTRRMITVHLPESVMNAPSRKAVTA